MDLIEEGPWSPEEDEMLINLVLKYGLRLLVIVKSIPGKSVDTYLSRLLEDGFLDQTAGRWSPEEDEMLRNLFEKHGSNWSPISESIPGKSPAKCWSRLHSLAKNDIDLIERLWSPEEDELLINLTKNETDQIERQWSSEEDEMLLNLLEKHGSNWSLISNSILGKSPAKCWSRWRSLAKNDTDLIERLWSSKEDNLLINLINDDTDQIEREWCSEEDEMLEYRVEKYQGGQGSSYIHHGNLCHEVGGVSRQPPSISEFLRGNMSSGGTHYFSRDKSAPSWNALTIRESSLTMIKGHDDVQEFAEGDFGLKDSSEVSSTSIVQEKGHNKESVVWINF